jgi:uncharacterized protein YjbI with pentapeptide repeats
MRGIKSSFVGVLTRPFTVRGRHFFCVTTYIGFPIAAQPRLLSDVDLWAFLPSVMGDSPTLDEGLPKARSEVLLSGAIHVTGEEPKPTFPARVAIGSIDKSIYGIGDRVWERGLPTAPAPFHSMPLTWDRAFGGEGFADNPVGKGAAPVQREDGSIVHPLPNLELPGQMIRDRKDRPRPAGVGPIDLSWAPRMKHVGTYDSAWLETRYPGFADDLDPRFFNLAPEDQQQDAAFVGDEPFLLEHLHPEYPRIEARLPGVRMRAFTTFSEDPASLAEVGLTGRTIWFFPEALHGVFLAQGVVEVAEDDGSDIHLLLIGAESLAQPRPLEHYVDAVRRRLDPDNPFSWLDESDLCPPELQADGGPASDNLELTTREGLRDGLQLGRAKRKVEEAREAQRAKGLDPDVVGPPAFPDPEPLPSLAELPARIAAIQQMAEAKKAEVAAASAARREALLAGLPEGVEPPSDAPPTGPPAPQADSTRGALQQLAAEAREAGQPQEELEAYLADEEQQAMLAEQDAKNVELYRMAAHLQEPAPPLESAQARGIRVRVAMAHDEGQSFAGQDLTGADLSRLLLRNADFRGALLESVDFGEADLRGARFDGAVLAHASFSAALLDGVSFRGANLGKARFVLARCETQIDFTEAELRGAVLTGAVLRGAHLDGVMLQDTELREVDLQNARGVDCRFIKVRFESCKLGGARLDKAVFVDVEAPGIDFGSAVLSEATFLRLHAPGSSWVSADLSGARFVLETDLTGAQMQGLRAPMVNLRGVDLTGADLSGALLDGADLSEANLSSAKLYRARARQALMTRTRLEGAMAVSIDLFEATLQKADVRSTDFRGANLYGADFALVHTDGKTQTADAIMDKVRSKPRREAP